MIEKSKTLSEMFSVNNSGIYSSQEFQPFVKLEDVLENVNVLEKENVTVLFWPEIEERSDSQSDILSQMEFIKTEVKEEPFSECIDDIVPTTNEELLPFNMNLPSEDSVVIKSEKEDNSFEIHSHEENPGEQLNNDEDVHDLIENEVTAGTVEEISEDSSSFNLQLSPDSVHNLEEINPEDPIDTSTTKTNQTIDNSLKNSSRTPVDYKSSQDMFEESPESYQDNAQGPSFMNASSSGPLSSSGDNQERQEEWSTQELTDVSQRLRLRSKQAKRLIMEVIRKRQMEDETLEAFKKRLRRM